MISISLHTSYYVLLNLRRTDSKQYDGNLFIQLVSVTDVRIFHHVVYCSCLELPRITTLR